MKLFKILAVAIISISLIGCNENEDISPNDCSTLANNPWNLTLFSGGWLGLFEFEEGDVVWNFYEGDSLVVSVNDSIAMIPELLPYFQAGVFDYEIISEDSISITNSGLGWSNYYAYSLIEGELIISDNPEADGIQYIFSCE